MAALSPRQGFFMGSDQQHLALITDDLRMQQLPWVDIHERQPRNINASLLGLHIPKAEHAGMS